MSNETFIIHCTNCTERDNTKLPQEYQGQVFLDDSTSVMLCPRCKCPEVMIENENYSPSYGYVTGGK
jgi:hypothetical protein